MILTPYEQGYEDGLTDYWDPLQFEGDVDDYSEYIAGYEDGTKAAADEGDDNNDK